MRKLSFVFALLVVGISINFVSCVYYSTNTIKGDRNIITSEESVSAFDKIDVSGSAAVNYHRSSEYRIVVAVDSNLLQFVEINTKNNTLYIGTADGSYSFTKFEVTVYCPHVVKISICGSGNFACMDKIVVPTLKADISGSGNITGTFECGNFSAHISGSGEISGQVVCEIFSTSISGSGEVTLVGNSKNSNINIVGSGSFNGNEFKTNNAELYVTGSGDIDIKVMDYLEANISGSGNITYRGNPKIDFSGSGSGRIRNKE